MVTQNARMADNVLDALGHQTRRDILALLKISPMPVGAIAEQFPISRPAVSKHLRILRSAGLVEFDVDGTRNIFRIKVSGFQAARSFLEAFWDDALSSFQQAAENQNESRA
jgi:DNA-binding transcriptional ArsR family regulator